MQTIVHTRRVGIALLMIAALASAADSAVTPASVFADNMVLQREQPLPIWGQADPGATVDVRLGSTSVTCTADSTGRWIAVLDEQPANTQPQSLVIRSGDDKVRLANVLVGDVWLCSGQSNMQMPLVDAERGDEFAAAKGNIPNLRLLVIPKRFTAEPCTSQEGKWTTSTPGTARQFSAVGFSFGATLADSPGMRDVPIGLIDATFGGTTAEAWIPAADLKPFDPNHLGNSMFGKPTEHYNAMIRPLVPMAFRGVVWYQGESNSDRPAIYAKLLDAMVSAWRRDFRARELPFIMIQLPAYNTPFQHRFFTWIREQQALVAQHTTGVSLVISYDTHNGSDLHPREKIIVGARAARLARANVYGDDLIASGPTHSSHTIEGVEARITFDTHGAALATSDGSNIVRGFQLAGSDGQFLFANGEILNCDTVSVSSASVSAPRNVRFAWGAVPDANLVSTAGLPAAPFRTDSYPPEDIEFVRVPTHRAVKTPAYELELDAIGSLRSLGIGGEQFIANDLGTGGGSAIPTFFGPRNLNQVAELGPKQLVFHDAEVSVTYTFGDATITIDVANQAPVALAYQIAVAQGVTTDAGSSTIRLHKGNAHLEALGFDTPPTSAAQKPLLKLTVPAGQTRTAELRKAE